MKTNYILLIALAFAFSSCSTAYRTGQTPDDVYYSPAPQREVYVSTQNQDEKNSYRYRNQEEEDIRRGIRDPRYRSNVSVSLGTGYNPYYNGYSYNPYSYNTYGYNPIYNPYRFDPFYDPYSYNPYSYNSYPKYGGNYYSGYYSPYYAPIIVVPSGSKINTNKGPRKYNLGTYNSPNTGARGNNGVTYHPGAQAPNVPPTRTFKATKETGVGSVLRRVFSAPSETSPRRYQSSTSNGNSRDFAPQTSNSGSQSRPAPTRTFSNPPAASSTPPATSAPVRTFRKN